MVLKVKDWILRDDAQFEAIEKKPLAPGVKKSGKDYYIQSVRRLKDDKIITRGFISKFERDSYYGIINGKKTSVFGVYISKFRYDLINVEIEIVFSQTVEDKKTNFNIVVEINNMEEHLNKLLHAKTGKENAPEKICPF